MTAKEMIEVMEHHNNGGEVECRYKLSNSDPGIKLESSCWTSATIPTWSWDLFQYRIKPEPKKTKIVWFWVVKQADGGWYLPPHMYTAEEVDEHFIDCTACKRMDMLGSQEVEV